MTKQNNVPALDNEDIRKLNTKKLVDNFGYIGDYFKQTKQSQKINLIINIISAFLMVMLIGGMFYVGISSAGGLDGLFDKATPNRYFNCSSATNKDIIRSFDDMKIYVEIYNGTCRLEHYKE